MVMFHEDGSAPPKEGCRCEACYRTRKTLIDPGILEMAVEARRSQKVEVAGQIVIFWVQSYLGGDTSLADARVEMIRALAKQTDGLFSQLNKLAMAAPILMAAPPKEGG